ncbi:MAG: hypothetical protein ACRC2V_25245, partial [Xenococcaceae cyanobacterium]
ETCAYFAIDIETTDSQDFHSNGLDYLRGQIRLIQVGLPSGKVIVFDCWTNEDRRFMALLQQTLRNRCIQVVGHNIMFDLLFLYRQFGFICESPRDTQILSTIRWCGIKEYRHGLAAVYQRLFDEKIDKTLQTSDWGQKELANSQLNYAALDVIYTLRCYRQLCKDIQSYESMPDLFGKKPLYSLQEIAIIECNVIPAFVSMQLQGFPVNIEKGERVIKEYQDALFDLFDPVKRKLGLDYNANNLKLAKEIYEQTGILLLVDRKQDDDEKALTRQQLTKLGWDSLVPPNKKISTSSAILFDYYTKTNNDILLRISLARSLKKLIDCLTSLVGSAKQNDGRARTFYRSLGATGTGRNTASGGGKSTLIALNLCNLPNHIEHELIDRYKLTPIREIIEAPANTKLGIIDLSSSHFRYMALHTGNDSILKVLQLKDPHLKHVQILLSQKGREITYEQCLELKKSDPEIAQYRKIAKTILYSIANVAGIHTMVASMKKDYIKADYDSVKEVRDVFVKTYPSLFEWQRYAHKCANANIREIKIQLGGRRYNKKFAVYKTPDGRLIHLPCFEQKRTNKKTKETFKIWECKISDVTSSTLLSPEALAQKKALIRCNQVQQSTSEGLSGDFKLIGFCYDELIFEVAHYPSTKALLAESYNIIAEEFALSLQGVESGMSIDGAGWLSCLADNYAEK